MAIKHIASVPIYVSDNESALDFYCNKLGFEKRADSVMDAEGHRWLEVCPPGSPTVVVLTNGFGDYSEDKVGGFSGLVFHADDVRGTYEELKAKGVNFTTPPEDQDWGMTMAIFEDTDKNAFVLVGPVKA